MEKEKHINVEEALSTIKRSLGELKNDINPNELNAEERAAILHEIEKAELVAYQVKLQPHLASLIENSPEKPVRDVIIHLLSFLRPEASSSVVAQVTQYILKAWEKRGIKAAA